jgi:Methyltransferase domain
MWGLISTTLPCKGELVRVDNKVDMQELQGDDQTYDFVFASSALKNLPNVYKAVSKARRILMRNGIAILPVPIVADRTIEYPEPNPSEFGHDVIALQFWAHSRYGNSTQGMWSATESIGCARLNYH